jgi:hypothetical protein
MKATSDEEPEYLVKGQDKAMYNFNIAQVEVEEQDGTLRTVFEYDYVEIKGKITKGKIIQALTDRKLDASVPCELEELAVDYNTAVDAIKNSELVNLSYAQLNAYINENITDLTSAKIYLKKLSKVVLAILKYLNAQ